MGLFRRAKTRLAATLSTTCRARKKPSNGRSAFYSYTSITGRDGKGKSKCGKCSTLREKPADGLRPRARADFPDQRNPRLYGLGVHRGALHLAGPACATARRGAAPDPDAAQLSVSRTVVHRPGRCLAGLAGSVRPARGVR